MTPPFFFSNVSGGPLNGIRAGLLGMARPLFTRLLPLALIVETFEGISTDTNWANPHSDDEPSSIFSEVM